MIRHALWIALLVASSAVRAAPALELSVTGATSIADVDNFSVITVIKNVGTEPLKLFDDPRTALSSFPENTFSVISSDGSYTPFIGAKVKYSYNTATLFTTLAPGESREITHDLALGYNFTSTGDYEIEASNLFHYQDGAGNAVPIYASLASVHTANLSGSVISRKVAERQSQLVRRVSFNSCSSTRSTQITTAVSSTVTYLNNAISYLNSHTSSTTRFTTWFGTFSSTSRSTVLGHYQKIASSNPQTYTYDCRCTMTDTYAYVFPDTFGTVYLCGLFWSAPTTGTDSKAGTIVHESSHFTANGGTQDYAYGQSKAKSLAKSNPAQAIMNADSHEYFAENNPALS